MEERKTKRRDFIKLFGLAAGVSVSGLSTAAALTTENIRKLDESQREFMDRYGIWMDEYIELIKLQREYPDNEKIKKEILTHADVAEKFQNELREHMKDETFSLIFRNAIEKVSKEI